MRQTSAGAAAPARSNTPVAQTATEAMLRAQLARAQATIVQLRDTITLLEASLSMRGGAAPARTAGGTPSATSHSQTAAFLPMRAAMSMYHPSMMCRQPMPQLFMQPNLQAFRMAAPGMQQYAAMQAAAMSQQQQQQRLAQKHPSFTFPAASVATAGPAQAPFAAAAAAAAATAMPSAPSTSNRAVGMPSVSPRSRTSSGASSDHDVPHAPRVQAAMPASPIAADEASDLAGVMDVATTLASVASKTPTHRPPSPTSPRSHASLRSASSVASVVAGAGGMRRVHQHHSMRGDLNPPRGGGKKGKLEAWERELTDDFIEAVRTRRISVAKGCLARELRKHVNLERHQEFYEKLVSRRKLNTVLAQFLKPRPAKRNRSAAHTSMSAAHRPAKIARHTGRAMATGAPTVLVA